MNQENKDMNQEVQVENENLMEKEQEKESKNKKKIPWKKIGKDVLNFFVKTFNGMAYGLFATLIIGVIFQQIGKLTGWEFFTSLATGVKALMGIGIGIGVANAMGFKDLKMICVSVAGGIATYVVNDPMSCYLAVIITGLCIKLILRKKTPVDIILVPLICCIISFGVVKLIGTPISNMMSGIGKFVNHATEYTPFFMGIIIAVIMGMALTAPISSAAIAISIHLSGIAAGAAVVGCCCQMVGFAVMSRKDNNIGTVISVFIGTSMLHFKNILKKPIIWLPTILASAILGPLSTMVFKISCTPSGAGMGTSGLVGQFGTLDAMGTGLNTWICILVMEILLPGVLVYLFDILFRKLKWIKEGDLTV